jgi:glycosyltransferase involved in cell wall biosynthesis
MFIFLKYVRPSWYFNRTKDVKIPILIDQSEEDTRNFPIVDRNVSFRENSSADMDIAYQLLMKGVIPESNSKKSELQEIEIAGVDDNYVFIKRHFGGAKSLYVLMIRLASFNNPIKEFLGYLKTLKVNRVDMYNDVMNTRGFESFESVLLKQNPLVSIVIPTLNRYDFLKDVLSDLEKQDYKNFEVLICDQSELVREAFYDNWNLDIKLIVQEEKALWLARNNSIKLAKSDYLMLTEDDVRLPKDWIRNHMKCLDYYEADISAGIFFPEGYAPSRNQTMFKIADHLATGNVCIKREVFRNIGLFDRQFEKQRMGDGEFGMRAFVAGYKSIANPLAYCVDIKAPTGGLREMGSWDSLRPTKLFAPRPIPSVMYFIRSYFNNTSAISYLALSVPFSYIPYHCRNSKKLKVVFLLLLPLLIPLMVFVCARSWSRANKMLQVGPKIDTLE